MTAADAEKMVRCVKRNVLGEGRGGGVLGQEWQCVKDDISSYRIVAGTDTGIGWSKGNEYQIYKPRQG